MANQNDVKVTERGWPGHFILSRKCMFRRNTLVTSSKDSVVVSTVGQLMNDKYEPEELEATTGRYYETKVFGATIDGVYTEGNAKDRRTFNSEWEICFDNAYDAPAGIDNIANDMHDTVVKEFVEKLS